MGMFDYVKYSAPCRGCGEIINEFQSKDGECLLQELTPNEVMNFYAMCPKCKMWNEFKVKHKDYEVIRIGSDAEEDI